VKITAKGLWVDTFRVWQEDHEISVFVFDIRLKAFA
jgi:hypothetical protein